MTKSPLARETETSLNFVNESLSIDKDVREKKRASGCLVYPGDESLPIYMGFIMNNLDQFRRIHLQLTSNGIGLLLTMGFGHGASLQVSSAHRNAADIG